MEVVSSWSLSCHSSCLQWAPPLGVTASSTVSEPMNLSTVPAEYHNLWKVFSKQCAHPLPSYSPCNCAIDLFPVPLNHYPPVGYTTCPAHRKKSMEAYITDSHAAGIIWPSSSQLVHSFLFDSMLSHCINYCELDSSIIKNKYSLPNMRDSAFEPFHWATIFTTLAEHLSPGQDTGGRLIENLPQHPQSILGLGVNTERIKLKLDPEKIWVMAEWPKLIILKHLKRFTGFTSIYHFFIRDYSLPVLWPLSPGLLRWT